MAVPYTFAGQAGPIPLSQLDANFAALTVTVGGAVYLNAGTLTSSVVIPSGQNGMAVGPLTVPTGMSITVASGSRLVIL